ncbi:MAG: hypothetical protein AAFU74_10515, partial [Bacteroidota bacterium]
KNGSYNNTANAKPVGNAVSSNQISDFRPHKQTKLCHAELDSASFYNRATIKIEPESDLNGQAGKFRLTLIYIHTLRVTRLNERTGSCQKKDPRTKTSDFRP